MPSVASQTPVIARNSLLQFLSALFARPGAALLTAPKIHLFTTGPTPITPDSVPGDFVEATFDGYAEVAIAALAPPVVTPNSTAVAGRTNAIFTCTGTTTPETIAGYWVDDTGAFIAAEYFALPFPMAAVGQYIDLLFLFPLVFIPETGA